MNQNQPQLPNGYHILETQVAGHLFTSAALGMLKNNGHVLKPYGKPECGARELSFYERVANADEGGDGGGGGADKMLKQLKKFIPKFHRKLKLEVNGKPEIFFEMEDLTHGMQKPCIMDIKMGKRTWDPLASPHKREVEEKKYVQCKQVLGICLPGFHMYDDKGILKKYDRDYGKKLDSEGCRQAIRNFLNAQSEPLYKALGEELLRQLYDIRAWFREQTLFNFYASSLLIVYDYEAIQRLKQQGPEQCLKCDPNNSANIQHCNGVITNGSDNDALAQHSFAKPHLYGRMSDDCSCIKSYVKVRMIDFAHVFPSTSDSLDTNYLFGLENLISILEDMVR
ncbi:inositol phosphate kinase 2 [Haematobia irritans]|uniref:inositol phosphate kinase 2 n=1 Tax=Haematobia irritans TaxID=7368 RepID=UPI003F4F6D5B